MDVSINIWYAILYVAGICYLTHILLLDSVFHRTKDAKKIIITNINGDTYVRYFDYLDLFRRRFITYVKYEDRWEVPYSNESHLFLCPYCLSFWINLGIIVILTLLGCLTPVEVTLYSLGVPYLVGRIISYE